MSTGAIEADVEARLAGLEPDVEVLLVELVGLHGSRGIRLYVDRPEGVDHQLCARVTGHLRDLLRDYTIEVSSPGPDRPLTRVEHYRKFMGRRVRVRTREAIDRKKEFKGDLIDADEGGISLAGDWGTITIPHERIRRSNLASSPVSVERPRR